MRQLLNAWPVLASVALYALAFPPFNLLFLVFVALAPWFAALRYGDGRGAFRSGLFFGLLFWLSQMTWLVPFVSRWTGSLWLGMVPWLLIPVLGVWYFGLAGWLVHRCWVTERPWLIPFAWMGVEAFRGFIPVFAYPWGLLAYPLAEFPVLAQLGALGTVYGVGAWCALGSVATALWLTKAPWFRLRNYMMTFVVLAVGSTLRYHQPLEGSDLRVTLGQLGVDLAFSKPEGREDRILEASDRALSVATSAKTELLVLPEAITTAIGDRARLPFSQTPQLPVLFGAHRKGEEGYYQSAFLFQDGRFSYKDKLRLVIFGEFVPLRDYIPGLSAFNLPGSDLLAGTDNKLLMLSDRLKLGTLICFEAIFSDVTDRLVSQGANLLSVISVDDWYMGTTAPNQLRQGTLWRSIESGLPLVRVGSLGYSLATDARGRVTYQVPTGIEAFPTVRVRVPEQSDAFAYRGWVPWIGVLTALLVIGDAWRQRASSRYSKSSS